MASNKAFLKDHAQTTLNISTYSGRQEFVARILGQIKKDCNNIKNMLL